MLQVSHLLLRRGSPKRQHIGILGPIHSCNMVPEKRHLYRFGHETNKKIFGENKEFLEAISFIRALIEKELKGYGSHSTWFSSCVQFECGQWSMSGRAFGVTMFDPDFEALQQAAGSLHFTNGQIDDGIHCLIGAVFVRILSFVRPQKTENDFASSKW